MKISIMNYWTLWSQFIPVPFLWSIWNVSPPPLFLCTFPLPLLLISNNHLHSMSKLRTDTFFKFSTMHLPLPSKLRTEPSAEMFCKFLMVRRTITHSLHFLSLTFLQLSIFYYSVFHTFFHCVLLLSQFSFNYTSFVSARCFLLVLLYFSLNK